MRILLLLLLLSLKTYGQARTELMSFRTVSVPAASISSDGMATKSQYRRLHFDLATERIGVGDTLLLKLASPRYSRPLVVSVKYCYSGCEQAIRDNVMTGYTEKRFSLDTTGSEPIRLVINDQSQYPDTTGQPEYFNNTQLKVIFIEIRNENRQTVRFDLGISLARLRNDDTAFPFVERKLKPTLTTSRYHAVLIGMSEYSDASLNLRRPTGDLRRLASILSARYDFASITRLINPDKKTVKDKLAELSYKLLNEDNLLIFYAGHAATINGNGYWALRDTRIGDVDSFLSNAALTSMLSQFHTQHILLMIDACYGYRVISRDLECDSRLQTWTEQFDSKSRKVISSSANEEAPDQSVFVDYLVRELAANEEPFLSAAELYHRMKLIVHNKSANHQRPAYGTIRGLTAGAGDFVFRRKPVKAN